VQCPYGVLAGWGENGGGGGEVLLRLSAVSGSKSSPTPSGETLHTGTAHGVGGVGWSGTRASGFDDQFSQETVVQDGSLGLSGFIKGVAVGNFDSQFVCVQQVSHAP